MTRTVFVPDGTVTTYRALAAIGITLHCGAGNRPINDRHVAALIASMQDHGYISSKGSVIAHSDGTIADGQHRVLAAQAVGIDFPVTIDNSFSLELADVLGKTSRPWNQADRLRRLAAEGNAVSLQLTSLMDEFSCSAPVALAALRRDQSTARRNVGTDAPASAGEMNDARRLLGELAGFLPHVTAVYSASRWLSAWRLVSSLPGFSADRFWSRYALYADERFYKSPRQSDLVRRMVELYNYRTDMVHRIAMPSVKEPSR